MVLPFQSRMTALCRSFSNPERPVLAEIAFQIGANWHLVTKSI